MTHQGLPVSGYKPQSQTNVDLVNENKILEERILRQIDKHFELYHTDKRMVSITKTKIQEAFMWLNRSVFQPDRIKLDED